VQQVRYHHWLPQRNSSRRGRPGWAEPEIWFRIVHVAVDGSNATHVAAYREQTVEIALGAKGAFENGNIGTLTRQVPAERVISALPPKDRNRKPPTPPRTPRVIELLRKALEWQALLQSGQVHNQAEIARREGITRARVTQVMALLRLAPEIQQHILSMPDAVRRPAITERALRPIAQLEDLADQKAKFQELVGIAAFPVRAEGPSASRPTFGHRGPDHSSFSERRPIA